MKRFIAFAAAVLYLTQPYASPLYEESQYISLVSPRNVPRVGEIVTVLIQENSSASSSTGSDANTSSSVSALIEGSFGSRDDAQFNVGSDFTGGGNINRSGKLVATMTVSIVDVSTSGLLHIDGEQTIRLNNEVQTIRLNGLVRPEDISDENTILSTRIGDARIDFVGKGVLSSAEKPGLITRFFNWIF